MKKKAILIKDYYSADGELHLYEKVIIESEMEDYYRVQTDMGKLYTIPKHIIKIIA